MTKSSTSNTGPAVPTFCVVGMVNKGKSSVIATLTENQNVPIGKEPRVTRKAHRYPVSVDDRTVLAVWDTPGFENANRMLHWLESVETSAANRESDVRRFVEEHHGDASFAMELELLGPILEGAAVIYVADASHPYKDLYEVELEILRRTGRPLMAILNKTSEGDHAEAWRRGLRQFAQLVRDFDAHSASWEDRRGLLRDFATLEPSWSGAIEDAVAALATERGHRFNDSARIIADLALDAVTMHFETVLPPGASPSDRTGKFEREYHELVRAREQRAWKDLATLWSVDAAKSAEAAGALPSGGNELFSEATWLDGMPPSRLAAVGAAGGAAVGGAIDVLLGGTSFLLGTLVGGAIGGGLGYARNSADLVSVKRMKRSIENLAEAERGGVTWRIGPHPSPNLWYVLIKRALEFLDALRSHAHARAEFELFESERLEGIDDALRARDTNFERVFAPLRRKPNRTPSGAERGDVFELTRDVLEAVLPEPGSGNES